MLKTKTIVYSDDSDYIGYPILIDGDMVLCPKCKTGHLFVRESNNRIECLYQPNCDYSTENR